MIELRWAKLALNDLDAIDRYYRQDHIDVADELISRIIVTANTLCDVPLAGPRTLSGNHKWRVRGTPYILFYRPATNHTRILRVRHGAQDNSHL